MGRGLRNNALRNIARSHKSLNFVELLEVLGEECTETEQIRQMERAVAIVVAELASPVTGVLVVVHVNLGAATDIVAVLDVRRVNGVAAPVVVVVSSSSRVVVRFSRNTSSPLATIAAINSTAQVVDFIMTTVVIVHAAGVNITTCALAVVAVCQLNVDLSRCRVQFPELHFNLELASLELKLLALKLELAPFEFESSFLQSKFTF
uniref:Uncharacterized protein n=1 Tax=Anopheles atroparvus TaxID=41427 RepID=A0A182J4W8_ANOAO